MRRFLIASMVALGCQGSLSFNGKPVQLASSEEPPPPPPPPQATQAQPPPQPHRSAPRVVAPAPAPKAAPDEDDDAEPDEEAHAPARAAPTPPAATSRFQAKPEPSEAELERLGRACYARKAAACRDLALIYLGSPSESCGTYLTNDPNGPFDEGGTTHEACKPPTYRHMGTCGVCATPTVGCEKGKGGPPWGTKDSTCPAGTLCSSYGYCFPKEEFPVPQHNVKHDQQCYVDRECASQECVITGMSAYGSVGHCH